MVLIAPPAERLIEGPQSATLADKLRFASLLALCGLSHAIPILLLIYFGSAENLAVETQETPVEIIVEQPPETEQDQSDSKPPANLTYLDEKPATDAPRAPTDQEARADAPDQTQELPNAKPDSEPPATRPAVDPAMTPDTSVAAKADEELAPEPERDRPDAEPINASDLQREETKAGTSTEKAAPQPETKPAPRERVATFVMMPEYKLASASRFTPVAGGQAEATYFSIIYGMVKPHLHVTADLINRAHSPVEISFFVDSGGRLREEHVVKTSGLPQLDLAALSALRAAAPFPATPTGGVLGLRFTYAGN